MDIRRVKFTQAKIASIKKQLAAGKPPKWCPDATVRGGTLFIDGKEVVPQNEVEKWLRARVYGDSKISLSRDSGYTDHIARETLGISRRRWFDFLKKQDVHQRYSVRPKTQKYPGQKIKRKGTVQIDLVEAKAVDIPTRQTDTYIFTCVDRLTSYLVAKRVDTKEVNPKKKRGTLIVFKEIIAEMEKALGTKVHTVESDDGGEFKSLLAAWLDKRGTKRKVLPLGAAVEARNGMLQRHLYKQIALGKKGGFDKHLQTAVQLCNETTSRITKERPIDAVSVPDKELADKFNTKRQAPGKRIGPSIRKGDTVMVLTKAKKADKFYKSYRDHWSKPMIVEKIVGRAVRIDGENYPRARVKKVAPVDKKSLSLLEERKARVRKKAAKKEKTVQAPRRSSRATKKLISQSKYAGKK